MTTKTHSARIFLKIKGGCCRTYTLPCVNMSIDDMNTMYDKIKNDFIMNSYDGRCADITDAKITQTTAEIKSLYGIKHKDSYKCEIVLSNPRLVVPCCDALRDCKTCLKNIASGKCCDEFIVNTIGKTLFADKYAKNQK